MKCQADDSPADTGNRTHTPIMTGSPFSRLHATLRRAEWARQRTDPLHWHVSPQLHFENFFFMLTSKMILLNKVAVQQECLDIRHCTHPCLSPAAPERPIFLCREDVSKARQDSPNTSISHGCRREAWTTIPTPCLTHTCRATYRPRATHSAFIS